MFHRESGVFKTTYPADMALYPLPIAKWTIVALAAIFVLIIPMMVHEYYLSILNLIFIAIVGALGLNILVGYTGQISIGHGAFMSVGAYTAANLAVKLDLPFWLTLPAGGLMAALIGVVVGMPSLRIKGLYLAIATLAGQLIIEWTINRAGQEPVAWSDPAQRTDDSGRWTGAGGTWTHDLTGFYTVEAHVAELEARASFTVTDALPRSPEPRASV